RLAFGGVRIWRLTEEITLSDETSSSYRGTSFAAGTWIIPTDQEFAAMAREVLDTQTYPDLRQYPGGPPERPYDAAGWSLPLAMDVRVVPVRAPLPADARDKMKLLGAMPEPAIKPEPYAAGLDNDRAPFDSV